MAPYLFLMDPIDRIDIEADSTFVLMLEAARREKPLLYAHPLALELRGAEAWVHARPISVQRVVGEHFSVGPVAEYRLDDMGAIFMRKDPPFDLNYYTATLVLDRVDHSRVVMINAPQGLRDFNEKLAAFYWPDLMPKSLISADRKSLRRFIEAEGQAVIKPLDAAGGAGILRLTADDLNIGSALDLLTKEGTVMIEAQAFIKEIERGDKRIILLDGQPIGAVNRIPQPGDIRANMHVGGTAHASTLTDRDREICAALAPELSRRGLIFVGIDVIGGWMTEVNVTSPTGLQEINHFDGVSLEAQIIDWVEARERVA